MNPDDIKIGKTYRGKKRRRCFGGAWDDRTILWISRKRTNAQYDSPAVRIGRHYPTTTMEAFCKWAKEESQGDTP